MIEDCKKTKDNQIKLGHDSSKTAAASKHGGGACVDRSGSASDTGSTDGKYSNVDSEPNIKQGQTQARFVSNDDPDEAKIYALAVSSGRYSLHALIWIHIHTPI